MTYWTLAIAGGAEKALADWGITACTRDVANLAKDSMDITMQAPVDSADPFPFGTKVTFWRNRTTTSTPAVSVLPATGISGFSGGTPFFVGKASAHEESFNYHFACPWEFFMERTIMKQLFFNYSAAAGANVADYRSQFVLGVSLNTLVGTADTVEGSSATNLLSIRQTAIQIVQYCIGVTATLPQYGSTPQFQFDALTSGGNNTSFTLNGNNVAARVSAGAKCLIPDFIPGYETDGAANQTVKISRVLRAPLDTVNDTMCAECLRYELKWLVGYLGSVLQWFDYTTTPPTLHIGTRDVLA